MRSPGPGLNAKTALMSMALAVGFFHLPVEAVLVILGVDEIMDMARTTVNLIGNCLATVVMGRWEGEFDDRKAEAYIQQQQPAVAA